MALVTNRDGTESVGGIARVRDAFVEAAGGKLVCLDATMTYDHSVAPNAQVLTFAGRWAADGAPFAVTSPPVMPGLSLATAARMLARDLVEPKPA